MEKDNETSKEIPNDFDTWNLLKQDINSRSTPPFFHERELWWCTLGKNIGFEQDGSGELYRRPVLILKGLSRQTCLVIPLTTSLHEHKFRPSAGLIEGKEVHALLTQIRAIDSKRLTSKIGVLNKVIFENLRKTAKDML